MISQEIPADARTRSAELGVNVSYGRKTDLNIRHLL
jgi:hypothetical protein